MAALKSIPDFKTHALEHCSTNSKWHTVAISKYHHCNFLRLEMGNPFVCIPYCLLKTDSLHTDLNISCMYIGAFVNGI